MSYDVRHNTSKEIQNVDLVGMNNIIKQHMILSHHPIALYNYWPIRFHPPKCKTYKVVLWHIFLNWHDLVYPSSTLVWPVLLAQVLPCPQLIFPSKTWIFGIYLNFQWQKSLKNQYLPHSESKFYQINSIKFYSSRSF
jgi:hypothetical protein